MKIQPQHFEALKAGVLSFTADHPFLQSEYRKKGLSEKRYRWDLLRSCSITDINGIEWICKNLYPYLDDTHIDTALKKAVSYITPS